MSLFLDATSDRGFPALNDLPWRSRTEIAIHATHRMLMIDNLHGELVSWLSTRPSDQIVRILERSLERTTHFKWFLGARPGEYIAWLHEYKDPKAFAQATSFAASVHNHRYSFCSRVLSGALHVASFVQPAGSDGPVRLAERRWIARDETMTLSHDDVHRIEEVAPHTCTILIQGPIARNFSTCYDLASGCERRVYDLQSRLPKTLALLSNAASCKPPTA